MSIERLTSLNKKITPTVQISFHMELDTYEQFNELANRFGYGSRRVILESALKDYLQKHRDK